MKVTCTFCGGSGKLQVGTGTPSSEGGEDWCLIDCDRCSGTGRVESRPRHTSLTLSDARMDRIDLHLEDEGKYLVVQTSSENVMGPFVELDAEAEASLLKFLKAREEER